MKSYIFSVAVEPDPKDDGTDGYHAYCPALPGCGTWGRTYEEVIQNIREAALVYVEDMIDDSLEVSRLCIEATEMACRS